MNFPGPIFGITTIKAFPVVAATNTSNQSATTTHTVDLPASISAGDLLVLILIFRNNPSVTTPSGWTLLYNTNSNHAFVCFYKSASGSEGASVDITTGASEESAHNAYRITGWASIESTEASASIDPPSHTASYGTKNTLWLAAAGNNDSGDSIGTIPSGFTNKLEIAATSNTTVGSGRKEDKVSSLNPAAWGTAGVNPHSSTIAIEPG